MKISTNTTRLFCYLVVLQGLWIFELVAQNAASAMNAPINLTAPRIKEGGATIWIGRTAYRDCHVREASADGKTVTLSTTTGVLQLEWSKVPPDAKAQLSEEYSAEIVRANGYTTGTKLTQHGSFIGSKAQPTASPDQKSPEKEALKQAYRRKIEALQWELYKLNAFGAGNPNSPSAQIIRGVINAEIAEKQAQLRVSMDKCTSCGR